MRLLVFGKTGQVARELARIAPDAVFLGREEADLMTPAACAEALEASDADAIINAAAWTAVDKAEAEEAAATVVNGDAPASMARAISRRERFSPPRTQRASDQGRVSSTVSPSSSRIFISRSLPARRASIRFSSSQRLHRAPSPPRSRLR